MRLISALSLATSLRTAIAEETLATPGVGCQYTLRQLQPQHCVIGAALTNEERQWLLQTDSLNGQSILTVLEHPDCPFTFEDVELAFRLQLAFDTTDPQFCVEEELADLENDGFDREATITNFLPRARRALLKAGISL
jgi:hypothetical protein